MNLELFIAKKIHFSKEGDRWSFFICIGSEESGTLPIEPQTPSVIISLLIKIWRLGRYEI